LPRPQKPTQKLRFFKALANQMQNKIVLKKFPSSPSEKTKNATNKPMKNF
jgi:hypothetical protein